MPERAIKVFISSTVEDLRPYREAAKEAVVEVGMTPKMQEYFVASGDKPPLDTCLAEVAGTDLLVVIVAHRYGWVPPDQSGADHKSITRLECEQAVADGHEVLAFLVDERASWPTDQRESWLLAKAGEDGAATPERVAEIQDNIRRLKEFKSWLSGRRIRATFTDPKDLHHAVYAALQDWRKRHGEGETPSAEAPPAVQQPITPRGLRSFEPQDHEWFPRLLPGGDDGRRLPLSIRFWKERFEQADPDRPMKVGLLYGPSGCGKSSLIKAGLLPALADYVLPVYLEASPDRTEADLLAKLREKLPDLPAGLSLGEALKHLAGQPELLTGRKVVLILDQFEQWLHAHQSGEETELAAALRECDGRHVQALVLARDEFVVAVHRFFESLGVLLREDVNLQKADLFDRQHATRVLAEYGRGYGRLPEDLDALTEDQERFLAGVIDQLQTQDRRVVAVHLALAAQMLKQRDWTTATLREVGGTAGIGFAFLQENFDRRTANPRHRAHREAAIAVLKELLPPPGAQLKGHARGVGELQEVSGYAQRPGDFTELLRLLDEDLRIITPTEQASEATAAADHNAAGAEAKYQLTHDYLVPALREWLAQGLRETRRGRAQLCLEERTRMWRDGQRESRFLPTLPEFVRIVCLAPRQGRSEDQQTMLGLAWRRYGLLGAASALAILALVLGGWRLWETTQNQRAGTLVQRLMEAPADAVPYAIDGLKPFLSRAVPDLKRSLEAGNLTNDPKAKLQRLHAAYALAEAGQAPPIDTLLEEIGSPPSGEEPHILAALSKAPNDALRAVVERFPKATTPAERAALAILALHLGRDFTLAERLLPLAKDPADRTAFIHRLGNWPGDWRPIAEVLAQRRSSFEHGDFRSGLCAALALIDLAPLSSAEQQTLAAVMEELYRESPDGGTHGAAFAALTRWGLDAATNAPPLMPTNRPPEGREWVVNSAGMTLVRIPADRFMMGSKNGETDEKPMHQVTLRKPLWILDREVTVAQFKRFQEERGASDWPGYYRDRSPTLDCPGNKISWFDAVAFCNWLSEQEDREPCYRLQNAQGEQSWECDFTANGYRLPTEAEWEYACRALSSGDYCYGDDPALLGEYAVTLENSELRTWPAGVKLPNGWGLFDMHGNVFEWCWDWYADYELDEQTDPIGPSNGTYRVLRGGSWRSIRAFVRSSYRYRGFPDYRDVFFGFRVVVSPF